MVKKLIRNSIIYKRGLIGASKAPEKKLFVFAQGRSGSTLLCRSLDTHSMIDCREEIFHNVWRPFPVTFACGVSKSSRALTFGFKVKIYQLTDRIGYDKPRRFLQKMSHQGWNIIYLWRRNVLRQAISWQIAKNKNMWHADAQNKYKVLIKTDLPPQKVLEKAREKQHLLQSEQQALGDLQHIKINYEDDLFYEETREQTMDKIFQYLQLPYEKTSVTMNRTSVDDLSKIIRNYESFEKEIAASEFSHLLP